MWGSEEENRSHDSKLILLDTSRPGECPGEFMSDSPVADPALSIMGVRVGRATTEVILLLVWATASQILAAADSCSEGISQRVSVRAMRPGGKKKH